jgi:hypothetical protein
MNRRFSLRRLVSVGVILAFALGAQTISVPAATALRPPSAESRHTLLDRLPPSVTAAPRAAAGLPAGAGVGGNVQVGPADQNVYSSIVVASDPTNGSNLLATSDVPTANQVAAFKSGDAGTTWSTAFPPLPGGPPNSFATEPAAAFDRAGTLYEASIGATTTSSSVSTQLVISKSTDKGASFASPVVIEPSATGPDKPMLAIDTTASPYQNRLYAAYDLNPDQNHQPVVVARSDDSITWHKTQVFDSGGDYGAVPAIGPDGTVYVGWEDYAAAHVVLARSGNGAASFSQPTIIAGTSLGFGVSLGSFGNYASCGYQALLGASPSVAVDQSGGPHRGSVYMAWDDRQFGAGMHIYFARSTDGGVQWSAPVQIDSGNVSGNGNDAWEPALSADASTGAITLSWYDRRDDPNNKLYRLYYTQSVDGGASFLPAQIPVSTAQSDATLDCNGTGLYQGLVAANGVAHPVWSDTRNGRNQVFTAAVDEIAVEQASRASRVFAPPATYAAGIGPGSVAIADFNGDGKPDVATGNGSMFFNSGNGTLVAKPLEGAMGNPIAAADFNGDGKQDLVVGTIVTIAGGYTTGGIQVYLGNGDGTFTAKPAVAIGGFPAGFAMGDFNGDGKLDMAVAGGPDAPHGVVVLLGNGDGTFGAPVDYTGLNTPTGIAAADVNGDGKLDLVESNSGNVAVLLGKGDGTFAAPVTYPAGQLTANGTGPLAIADFNGDGKPDIATNQGILLNNGSGAFGALIPYPIVPPSSYGSAFLAVADFTGDGKADVILADSSQFSLYAGNGDGTVQPGVKYDPGTGGTPSAIAVADLNGDARADLVVTTLGSASPPTSMAVFLAGSPAATASAPLAFGGQSVLTSGAAQSVTLTNSGTVTLNVAMARRGGINPDDFQETSDGCSGTVLAPGASCTVGVRLVPNAAGARTASLLFDDNAASSPQTVGLSGTGIFGGQYHPLPPSRILDTRDGTGTGFAQPIGPQGSLQVTVAGRGGVPSANVTAVVLNTTVTDTTAASYLTVYPTGVPQPVASNLNWTAGQTIPNLVEVAVGSGGQVTVFNAAGSTNVIFDVAGYVTSPPPSDAAGLYTPVVPGRVLDTRDGTGGVSAAKLGPGGTLSVKIAGQKNVPPTGVSAVVLNVTVTNPSSASYLTAYPSGTSRPLASNLNFLPGQTIPNRVIVKVGTDLATGSGSVTVYNALGKVDVIADVGGWFSDGTTASSGSTFIGVTPIRLLDTRDGTGTFYSAIGQGQTINVMVAGRGPVPTMAAGPPTAVVLNVTVTGGTAPSYLTAWPDGTSQPVASDLNYVAGQTVPNLVVVKVGANGKVDLFNAAGSVNIIADVVGWYG